MLQYVRRHDAGIFLRQSFVRGIFVGDRAMFEDLNRAIEVNDIHPAIDTVFDFDDAPQAYSHMIAARHFAKIVVRI